MKYIKLKTLTTRKQLIDGSFVQLDYKEHIEQMACELTSQSQTGFDRNTNKKALRILRALDKIKVGANILTLEDADWEYLKERSQTYAFRFADPAIEEFFEDIDNAASDKEGLFSGDREQKAMEQGG